MGKTGILLINLGSPKSPTPPDVRAYLGEFLMDPLVLTMPFPLRYLLVHLLILPKRPKQSAEAYQKIWTSEGSPLVVTTERVGKELSNVLADYAVAVGMRYQEPSIRQAIQLLLEQDVDQINLIPMYPHYAGSTYESTVQKVRNELRSLAPAMPLSIVPPYYEHADYVKALCDVSREGLEGPYDKLLFSFHGLPESHIRKADPTGCHCLESKDCCKGSHPAHATCYRAQCFKTVEAVVEQMGIPPEKIEVCFQSRLGRQPWLAPSTTDTIQRVADEGAKCIAVICPSFVTDCLETIEEIGLRGRKTFINAGGQELRLIPCLNEHPSWIAALQSLIGTAQEDH